MATEDADDLVSFQDVRVIRSTAPALLCRIGEKSVWLPRQHISGKLWCTGDRGRDVLRVPLRQCILAFHVVAAVGLTRRYRPRCIWCNQIGTRLMPSKGQRLFAALRRLWTSFWRRRSFVAAESKHDEMDLGSAAARGRFWTEFREGQREAEANSSRPR